MISTKLIIFLAVGTVLMWLPMVVMATWYKIRIWKTIPTAILLTIFGTVGTYIWYFLENRGVGRSFYGAVFLVPVFFLAISKILKISYGNLLDLCAPAECVMLSIMKIQCYVDGCCGGIKLFTTANGIAVFFPSQIVELINAILIFVVLLLLARQERNRKAIYPWYLIIYGSSRFVLNFFRAGISLFWGLSIGSIWSLCAMSFGFIALFIMKKEKK